MIFQAPRELWSRLKWLRRRRQLDADLDAELEHHVELRAAKNTAAGMDTAEALYAARRQFGNVSLVKEDTRTVWIFSWLEALRQDLHYGLRLLRKTPGFTAVAVLTLALGIGASTAVFSIVNAILLRSLPFPDPDKILLPLLMTPPGVNTGYDYFPWHPKQFFLVKAEQTAFQALGAFQSDAFNLTAAGDPVLLDGFRVSAGFFPSLGISPVIGRIFVEEEDKPGHELEVILSHNLWQERFACDPSVLGRPIHLNGRSYTVIGVMPSGFVFPRAEEMPRVFNFPREAQLWVPLATTADYKGPSELALVGRLHPSFTLQQAQTQLHLVSKHAEQADPAWKGWFTIRTVPLQSEIVADMRRPLLLILGAVGVVLLIACSNVANLLLARSLTRKKEITLRAALGAANTRLLRQLLTESLFLSTIGGLAGILFANIAVHFLKLLGPANLPRLREVTLDLRVLLFALAIALVTGLLFGLAPALIAARVDIAEALKEGGQRAGAGPANLKLRSALLVSQVALALVLVVSSGLLLRSFFNLLRANGGFNPEKTLTFQLSLPANKYADTAQIVAFYRNALEHLRALPGVQSAGLGETVPMSGEGEATGIRLPDRPRSSDKDIPFANYTMISPGYLSAVGTPLLQGRDFQESDTLDSLPVSLVNESFVRKYWPGQNPIGKQLGVGSTRYPLTTIIGVVADSKHLSLREDVVPEMYVPFTQKVWPSLLNMRVALRTRVDPASMSAGARHAVQSLDPDLPLAKVATLQTLVNDSLAQPRFAMLLLASFASLALFLACIGMYGVISYSVAQRTREIGVRVALGAARGDISRMVLRQGALLASLGIAIGLLTAFAVTRLMASFLYGVRPADPLTFTSVSLLLIAVALFACFLPARRATRVDPLVALRFE